MKTGDDRLWRYNSEDCCRTFEVDEALQQVVDKMGLRAPHDFQQSLFIPTLKAMVREEALILSLAPSLAQETFTPMEERVCMEAAVAGWLWC